MSNKLPTSSSDHGGFAVPQSPSVVRTNNKRQELVQLLSELEAGQSSVVDPSPFDSASLTSAQVIQLEKAYQCLVSPSRKTSVARRSVTEIEDLMRTLKTQYQTAMQSMSTCSSTTTTSTTANAMTADGADLMTNSGSTSHNMQLLLSRLSTAEHHSARPTVSMSAVEASMVSFNSSMDASQLHEGMGDHGSNKAEIVYSLLSMLSSQDRLDSSHTLMLISREPDTCALMRQSGCLPIIISLLHPGDVWAKPPQFPDDMEVLHNAKTALHNLVDAQSDETKRRRELRVLKALDKIRQYTLHLRMVHAGMEQLVDGACTQELCSVVNVLMKLSFDEPHRHATTQLGGLQAIAELLISDQMVFGITAAPESSLAIRRVIGMALTNLTFGHPISKQTLCLFPRFLETVNQQINSTSEPLKQVFASVLRNLSWKAETCSKTALRECGSVACLMRAAMSAQQESTLKSLLSALWNLSSHCSENKAEICRTDGALKFLVQVLAYHSPSGSLAVIENGGGILRNISSQIAVSESYRVILRENNCAQILLKHLRSSSLTVVSNACGTLWNLSARCATDQRLLWQLGAVPMLRCLVNSRHKMISMGSAAALKNLLASRPTDGSDSDASAGPLSQRKLRALEQDLDAQLMLGNSDDGGDQAVMSPTQAGVSNPSANGLSNSARVWSSEGHVAMSSSSTSQGTSSRIMYASTHSARHTQAHQMMSMLLSADIVRPVSSSVVSSSSQHHQPRSARSPSSNSMRSSTDSVSKQQLQEEDRSATQRFQMSYNRRQSRRQQHQQYQMSGPNSRANTLPASYVSNDVFAVPVVPSSARTPGLSQQQHSLPKQQQRVAFQMQPTSDYDIDDLEDEQPRKFGTERTPHQSQRGSQNDINKVGSMNVPTSTQPSMGFFASASVPQQRQVQQISRTKPNPDGPSPPKTDQSGTNTPGYGHGAMLSMNVSRHSSVESLGSCDDGQSLHSTHTSAPSTRMHTGGRVSPSDLPDSPGHASPNVLQMVNQTAAHHAQQQQMRNAAQHQQSLPVVCGASTHTNGSHCDAELTKAYKEDSSTSFDDARSSLSALTIDSDTKVHAPRKLLELSALMATPRAPQPQHIVHHDYEPTPPSDPSNSNPSDSPPTNNQTHNCSSSDPEYGTFDLTNESLVLKKSIEAAMPTPKADKPKRTVVQMVESKHNVSAASPAIPPVPHAASGSPAFPLHQQPLKPFNVANDEQQQLDDEEYDDEEEVKAFKYEGDGGSICHGHSVAQQGASTCSTGGSSRAEPSGQPRGSDISHFIQSAMPKPKTAAQTSSTTSHRGKNVAVTKPMMRANASSFPNVVEHRKHPDEEVKKFAVEHTPVEQSRCASPSAEQHLADMPQPTASDDCAQFEGCTAPETPTEYSSLDEHIQSAMPKPNMSKSHSKSKIKSSPSSKDNRRSPPVTAVTQPRDNHSDVMLEDIEPPAGVMFESTTNQTSCSMFCDKNEEQICDASALLRQSPKKQQTHTADIQQAQPDTAADVKKSMSEASDLSEDNFDVVDMIEDFEVAVEETVVKSETITFGNLLDFDLANRVSSSSGQFACASGSDNDPGVGDTTLMSEPVDLSDIINDSSLDTPNFGLTVEEDILIECDRLSLNRSITRENSNQSTSTSHSDIQTTTTTVTTVKTTTTPRIVKPAPQPNYLQQFQARKLAESNADASKKSVRGGGSRAGNGSKPVSSAKPVPSPTVPSISSPVASGVRTTKTAQLRAKRASESSTDQSVTSGSRDNINQSPAPYSPRPSLTGVSKSSPRASPLIAATSTPSNKTTTTAKKTDSAAGKSLASPIQYAKNRSPKTTSELQQPTKVDVKPTGPSRIPPPSVPPKPRAVGNGTTGGAKTAVSKIAVPTGTSTNAQAQTCPGTPTNRSPSARVPPFNYRQPGLTSANNTTSYKAATATTGIPAKPSPSKIASPAKKSAPSTPSKQSPPSNKSSSSTKPESHNKSSAETAKPMSTADSKPSSKRMLVTTV